MNWRDLVAKLWPVQPPLTEELIRASADRSGQVNRRAFLGLCGAGVAALALDPEKLLWTGPKPSIIVPDQTLETATTIDEAVRKALTILWSDGTRHDIAGSLAHYGGFENLKRMVERDGGTIITSRKWVDAFEETPGRPRRPPRVSSLFFGTESEIAEAERAMAKSLRVVITDA